MSGDRSRYSEVLKGVAWAVMDQQYTNDSIETLAVQFGDYCNITSSEVQKVMSESINLTINRLN